MTHEDSAAGGGHAEATRTEAEEAAERTATATGFAGSVLGAVGGPPGAAVGGLVGGTAGYLAGYAAASAEESMGGGEHEHGHDAGTTGPRSTAIPVDEEGIG